jgi:hypothetical protein
MGDISRNTGRAVTPGRGGKTKPRRGPKQDSGVRFQDEPRPEQGIGGINLSRPRPADDEVSVENRRVIPIEPVEGETIQDRVDRFRRRRPILTGALAVGSAIADGEVKGRIALNKRPRR